ncbi:DUF4381 domain-containing protein [Microbulbifer agarilyticus]|uniref:DUF4381 domain-containing protein n=1 Tax=Microbulbifer agarilyticus TaxID=260552 RepID=UPI001C93A827|nr:DUF4381 domain-containing protein [Microbulbifer agarilyticus]MBY6212253.1 DUF4381 domain-containing protein [Microbulbifer agarilyticus]
MTLLSASAKQATPPPPAIDQPPNQPPVMTPEMQQLLGQLKDIHEPTPIGWWPLAPGWWMLAAALIALLFGAIWLFSYLRRKRQEKQYRVEGERLLKELDLDQPRAVESINLLLKRVAVVTFGRASSGPLTGQHWIEFLETTAATAMPESARRALLESLYSAKEASNDDLEDLRGYAIQWVRKHQRAESTPGIAPIQQGTAGANNV